MAPTAYEDLFLHDIRQAPEDDLPRLVYADWLQDNADAARGEFIHVQVRLARASATDPDVPALKRREQELLGRHGPAWRRPLPPWLRGGAVFRRGFIDEFCGTAGAFFRDDPEDFFRVAPATVLRLGGITAAQLGLLRNAPYLPAVRELDLSSPQYGCAWLFNDLRLDRAARLTSLRLVRVYPSVVGLEQLLAQEWVGRVEHLALISCHLTDDHCTVLLAWPGLQKLRSLDVSGNLLQGVVAPLCRVLGKRLKTGGPAALSAPPAAPAPPASSAAAAAPASAGPAAPPAAPPAPSGSSRTG